MYVSKKTGLGSLQYLKVRLRWGICIFEAELFSQIFINTGLSITLTTEGIIMVSLFENTIFVAHLCTKMHQKLLGS